MHLKSDQGLRQRLWHYRAFFFTLIVISLIWLISNMSEQKAYRETYPLRFTGFDSVRYATTLADTVVTLDITSNGFRALQRSLATRRTIEINVASKLGKGNSDGYELTLSTNEFSEVFTSQVDMRGVESLAPVQQSLALRLALRESKAFLPDIEKVRFQFEGMTGIFGTPTVKPDTIWLYGSRASLDQIDHIEAQPQTIGGIMKSGTFEVKLDPVWKKFSDVRPSATKLSVFLPVQRYVQRTVAVPLRIVNSDNVKRIHLYPDQVSVSFMVPQSEYNKYTASDFSVDVTIDSDSLSSLHPVVTAFPANVRILSVSPEEVQYIIIK